MGLTFVEAVVSHNKKKKKINLLVDSGASYSVLPQTIWKELGIVPKKEMEFILADGNKIKRKISECFFQLPQGSAHSPVVLGEKNDEAILGVVTLENLGLVLNPFERTLQTMTLRLG